MKAKAAVRSQSLNWHWFDTRRDYDGDYNDYGKWLIFAPIDTLAQYANKLVPFLERGELGPVMKYSVQPSPGKTSGVMCIYTTDCHNKDDVARVLKGLRKAGIEGTLYYKSDWMTERGEKGSMYCSKEFEG